MPNLLTSTSLSDAMNLTDLTDDRHGAHAMQLLMKEVYTALSDAWGCPRQIIRTSPVVSLENNYDRLGYPPDGAARDARYTRYISDQLILRTQTSSAIPDTLAGLSLDPPADLLLILPGLVYRRDSIDRLHTGEPHQLDLWRIVDSQTGPTMTRQALEEMVTLAMEAALPHVKWRITRSPHPYTEDGVQIDALWHGDWIEVGECGLAARNILDQASLTHHTGLAMGLGLDRLLMVRKNIPDIRLLRSPDKRVRDQMNNLSPYHLVSMMPSITRDLSLCVDQSLSEEELGDQIRQSLPEIDCIESLVIKSETAYAQLPTVAHQRMGMKPGQKNVLLQLTIRHLARTLTDAEANTIRNQVYQLLHQGDRHELAQ